ncbi:MAG TPA: M23 family metallopeptidase [Ferruginibacter sp.]|nr:M23 family metallopeptidase [Ferruginibacter sp.]HNJ96401.1 M23 family metallopeptidase [Ferruginibacter sp.]
MKKRYFILLLAIAGFLFYYVYAGRITANTDTYIYALPFEPGVSYKVVQGYGGLFTHQRIAALDFAMPEGTPVCAAREGTVYSYKNDSRDGGLLPGNKRKANYLIIRHDDGSFGCYWHLRQNGVVVKKGRVSKGQLIGYSGRTGQVLKPHLHFSVKRTLNYEMNSFVQTRFNTSEGINILSSGRSYRKP